MAVAVKESTGMTFPRLQSKLALGSLAGALYLLGCLAIVFYGVQYAWESWIAPSVTNTPGSAVDTTFRILVSLAVAVGLVVLGARLVGPKPVAGLRAGVFLAFVTLVLIGLITIGIGNWMDARYGELNPGLGMGITAGVGIALLILGGMFLVRPGYDRLVLRLEEQGWFNAESYKKGQGVRVRRGTMLGLLILAGCGVFTLLSHDTLRRGGDDWIVTLPFTGGRLLRLLPDLQFTVPIIIAAVSLWLAYRVVNFPMFADFLIATEAELNKVSWTTRKRLVQDTIVVLVTVFLLTGFMFGVDIVWVKVLSSPWIQVLQAGDDKPKNAAGPLDW
jgi:preprotein translocase SecE subunit